MLEFFDANCTYGRNKTNEPTPFPTLKEVIEDMDRVGVAKTTLWHAQQLESGWEIGTKIILDEINATPGAKERISPSWCVVPTLTGEQESPDKILENMRKANAGTVRIFPEEHRWELYPVAIGDLFDVFIQNHIPVYLPANRLGWDRIYRTMMLFPNLYAIVSNCGLWGPDRRIRPLLKAYKNLYFETSEYWAAGSIADTVNAVGPERILYGSGAPRYERGAMMLAIKHADISDDAKKLIASGNLERLLKH